MSEWAISLRCQLEIAVGWRDHNQSRGYHTVAVQGLWLLWRKS